MRSTQPQVLSVERDGGAAQITLVAQEDLSYFEGHFRDCALLPGVVQTHWAIELGRKHLDVGGAFRELKGVKFMRVIQPGELLTLTLAHDEARGELSFEYRRDAAMCSSGAAIFAP